MDITLWRFYNNDLTEAMLRNQKTLNMEAFEVKPYAFTRDKDIARRFKKERDMKKFQIFKDNISIEEYSKYAARFQEYMLGFFKIRKLENEKIVTVSVLSNDLELCNTDVDPVEQIIELVSLVGITNPTILKHDIVDALDNLGYTGLWAITNDLGDTTDVPSFTLDQFMVYFDNIMDTL